MFSSAALLIFGLGRRAASSSRSGLPALPRRSLPPLFCSWPIVGNCRRPTSWKNGFPTSRIPARSQSMISCGCAVASPRRATRRSWTQSTTIPPCPPQRSRSRWRNWPKLKHQFKPPGQEGVYTNLNYYILGGIVQKITGADVGVFITDNIIHKLGLRQTSYPIREVVRPKVRSSVRLVASVAWPLATVGAKRSFEE